METDGKNTILVVDDDFDMAESLKDTLTEEGYAVAVARDGLEALDYLKANPRPALILLDWMMPRCDGMTFRERQREDAALATIPVVLLTADVHLKEKVERMGARDYLAKPVGLRRLLDVVDSARG